MKAWSISETLYISPYIFGHNLENHLENEFQFQLQGYAPGGVAVNPLGHKRA
jgi:hypothetical protein